MALLLKESGLLIPPTHPEAAPSLGMNIIPLFETIDDLRRAGAIMGAIFALPHYRAPVSYTHLDVYKRQLVTRKPSSMMISSTMPPFKTMCAFPGSWFPAW